MPPDRSSYRPRVNSPKVSAFLSRFYKSLESRRDHFNSTECELETTKSIGTLPTIRSHLTADKAALIKDWVDRVNRHLRHGKAAKQLIKQPKASDVTPIPATHENKTDQPPKYKQLTLNSTKLRRVAIAPRETLSNPGWKEDKVEEETRHLETGEKELSGQNASYEKKEEEKQLLSSHQTTDDKKPRYLRMVCVEIMVPRELQMQKTRVCEQSPKHNGKRKRMVTNHQEKVMKRPRLAAGKG